MNKRFFLVTKNITYKSKAHVIGDVIVECNEPDHDPHFACLLAYVGESEDFLVEDDMDNIHLRELNKEEFVRYRAGKKAKYRNIFVEEGAPALIFKEIKSLDREADSLRRSKDEKSAEKKKKSVVDKLNEQEQIIADLRLKLELLASSDSEKMESLQEEEIDLINNPEDVLNPPNEKKKKKKGK